MWTEVSKDRTAGLLALGPLGVSTPPRVPRIESPWDEEQFWPCVSVRVCMSVSVCWSQRRATDASHVQFTLALYPHRTVVAVCSLCYWCCCAVQHPSVAL